MIYLDNATTSFPKAPGVAEAAAAQLASLGGSAGRSEHGPARAAVQVLYETRERLAALVGVARPDRLVFTKNATEALNLVINGCARPGGLVVTTALEHNAVMRPLRFLEARAGLRLRVLESDASGVPRRDALARALLERPVLMVATAASNVTGQMLPIGEMAEACSAAGVPFCVDASQFVGHRRIDFEGLGAAALCFSCHKGLLGPSGLGALCLREDFAPEPLIRGGTGSRSESEEQPDFLPDRYEAGTQNLVGLAGMLAALRFFEEVGMESLARAESAAVDRLMEGLASIGGMRLLGPPPGSARAPLVSLVSASRPAADLALELDRRGIAARPGLHCAPAAHRWAGSLDRGGALRLSPGPFTTAAEVDAALAALKEILA
ncbi:MAG TPA: aminotransferase class V-fold PLP-dependent enzyme [Rectinemataceae bacterium]|nr:aminotransferase class V-fold PLP-dependent enzyme [Rectinemataceae bacterium]